MRFSEPETMPIRIVIVDDNTDFRNILEIFLSSAADIRVVGTASDGIEAVSLIHDLRPDIVLLDMVLPRLDGLGVLKEIRQSLPENRPLFIMMSALADEANRQSAAELGASCYMIKPFDFNELRRRIYDTYAAGP
jgi:two-component system response regulator (stage 0 sporulation protein A)